MKADFDKIKIVMEHLDRLIMTVWDLYKGIEDQKQFALAIKDFEFKDCLFRFKKGHFTTVQEWFSKLSIDRLVDIVKERLT